LEYVEFEAAVTAAVRAARDEDPHLVAVQKALPAVCDSLCTVTGVVKTGLESNDSSMRCMNSSMQHMERRMATLENVVTNFCSGAFTFTPRSPGATAAPAGPMPAPTAIESLEEQPPTHRLLRGTTTTTDLWKEWTMGLGGQPSVEDLDERWGSRWRHGADSQRKVVITEIKRLVAGGREAREVVDSLEAQRLRTKVSLSQVINGLKVAAKAREGGN
jgi:transcriptional activator of glycolytic enzymes GCR1